MRSTAVLVAVVLACGDGGRSRPSPNAVPAGSRGRALAERFECNRCHEGAGLAAAPLDRACLGCHRAILSGTFPAAPDALARWRGHLVSLVAVPSLSGVARLRRDWVTRFLLDPVDVRPALAATMPRLALDPAQAAQLAAWLVPSRPDASVEVPRSDALVAEGLRWMATFGCSGCHAFGGVPARASVALAVDLDATRDRMDGVTLVEWLLDPHRFDPDTTMPRVPMGRSQAIAIAAALLYAPRAPRFRPASEPPIEPVGRPVSFDELSTRVFRRTCWHCHADPDFAFGDGGPGNTGGLGFGGIGLSLVDARSLASGALDRAGRRRSVFRAIDGAAGPMPLLVGVLMARRAEERGRPLAGVRGMPLGLPALSREEIALVAGWIAQGRPD